GASPRRRRRRPPFHLPARSGVMRRWLPPRSRGPFQVPARDRVSSLPAPYSFPQLVLSVQGVRSAFRLVEAMTRHFTERKRNRHFVRWVAHERLGKMIVALVAAALASTAQGPQIAAATAPCHAAPTLCLAPRNSG